MHHFNYEDGRLHCEGVALDEIADTVGTPVYVYSTATLRRHAKVIAAAFDGMDCLIAYSVKANGNLAVLKTLASEGCGADVVSGGELRRALAAGIPADRIVFSGVGKTRDEMALGLEVGIHQFNVESGAELIALSEVAMSLRKVAPVALRVNPDVAAGGHPNISTGKAGDKFGVPWAEAPELYHQIKALPGVEAVGVDVHIGSQIGELAPMRAAFCRSPVGHEKAPTMRPRSNLVVRPSTRPCPRLGGQLARVCLRSERCRSVLSKRAAMLGNALRRY